MLHWRAYWSNLHEKLKKVSKSIWIYVIFVEIGMILTFLSSIYHLLGTYEHLRLPKEARDDFKFDWATVTEVTKKRININSTFSLSPRHMYLNQNQTFSNLQLLISYLIFSFDFLNDVLQILPKTRCHEALKTNRNLLLGPFLFILQQILLRKQIYLILNQCV